MAIVSGTALSNSAFPVIAIGAGGSARPPAVRDFTGIAAASSNVRPASGAGNGRAAPISGGQTPAVPSSAFAARDTGIDGQNGVRLGGDNGALLDLSTTLGAQEAGGEEGSEAQDTGGLTEAEQEQVAELSRADREVRRHESAHAAVGGAFAGAPTFTFERGPDGQLYAVAGEVSIDTAPVDGDPQATIQKLQIVRSAALAPGDPSAQDRAVAAQAEAGIRRAQAELAAQRAEELTGEGDGAATEVNGGATEQGGQSSPAGNAFGARGDQASGADRRIGQAVNLLDIAV
jgi:hypothetical protein